MTVPPYAAACKYPLHDSNDSLSSLSKFSLTSNDTDVCMIGTSVIADRYRARGLAACAAALIGAAGYTASALLPANAYNVSHLASRPSRSPTLTSMKRVT